MKLTKEERRAVRALHEVSTQAQRMKGRIDRLRGCITHDPASYQLERISVLLATLKTVATETKKHVHRVRLLGA